VPRAVVEAEETAAAPTTEITGQAPVDAAAAKEGDKGDKKAAGDKKEAGKKD
jgi:hypothetical protein